MPDQHRIFTTPVMNVCPYCVAKAEKKGRTKAEVDAVIGWLKTVKNASALGLTQLEDFRTSRAAA